MINCLLIGTREKLSYYSAIVGKIAYFDEPELLVLEADDEIPSLNMQLYDAVMILSPVSHPFLLISGALREKRSLFFVDQPLLALPDLQALNKLHYEAGGILYAGISELHHPLIEDFLEAGGKHLLYRYNKNIRHKSQLRRTLLNAISFITLLYPLQVKNIDVNTLAAGDSHNPGIKIRLKLYDSSVAYIMIVFSSRNDHNILIESLNGNFTFHFTHNYIENTHGYRFEGTPVYDSDLDIRVLSDFALCVVLNKKPRFDFFHYSLTFKLLKKIENILPR